MSSNSECFGCGRSGHWIKHCPNASGARGRGRGRGRGKGTIYYPDHTQYRIAITKIPELHFFNSTVHMLNKLVAVVVIVVPDGTY